MDKSHLKELEDSKANRKDQDCHVRLVLFGNWTKRRDRP